MKTTENFIINRYGKVQIATRKVFGTFKVNLKGENQKEGQEGQVARLAPMPAPEFKIHA